MMFTCTVITTNADAGQWLYTKPVEQVTSHGLTAYSEHNTMLI